MKTAAQPPNGLRVSNKRGSNIPQYELISARQWNRLRRGQISKTIYLATQGNHKSPIIHHYYVITSADTPEISS